LKTKSERHHLEISCPIELAILQYNTVHYSTVVLQHE